MSKLSKFLKTSTGGVVKDLVIDALVAKAKKQSADVRRVADVVEPVLETYQAVKRNGSDDPLKDTIYARAKAEISADAINVVTGDNVQELLEELVPKPYQKTSYFILLIATVFGGAALVFGTSLYLPQLDYLTNAQRADILETMFNGWAYISGIVVGGNVVARGGLTLLKQWLQNQIVKSAVEGPDEMPPTQYQPQAFTPVEQPVVVPLPDEAPPTSGVAIDKSVEFTALHEAG